MHGIIYIYIYIYIIFFLVFGSGTRLLTGHRILPSFPYPSLVPWNNQSHFHTILNTIVPINKQTNKRRATKPTSHNKLIRLLRFLRLVFVCAKVNRTNETRNKPNKQTNKTSNFTIQKAHGWIEFSVCFFSTFFFVDFFPFVGISVVVFSFICWFVFFFLPFF